MNKMLLLSLFLAVALYISISGGYSQDSLFLKDNAAKTDYANNESLNENVNDTLVQGISGEEESRVELIPRKIFFGNPEITQILISPNGKWIGCIAPLNGVLNIWLAPSNNISSIKPITNDTFRGIQSYSLAFDNRHVLYTQDKKGDENWTVYSVDLITGVTKAITPEVGVNARLLVNNHRFPNEALVGLNDRDPRYHDFYLVNISTGEKRLLLMNEVGFNHFGVDSNLKIRLGFNTTPEGGEEIFERLENGTWKLFIKVDPQDEMATYPIRYDESGDILYMRESRGREMTALTAINLTSGVEEVLAENEKADIDGTMPHPTKRTPQAASYNYERRNWIILDPSIKADMEYLSSVEEGDFEPTSRTLDDRRWIVSYRIDDGPVKYYLYDRDEGKAEFLFSNRAALEKLPLSKMNPVVLKSRDGLNLVSYYTLPVGSDTDNDDLPEKPLPMVLLVHGGPWGRDEWGYDPEHQWLANRGYAVLSVNFRGSTGFGKSFINAGDREWGRKMQYDLLDAVNWSIEKGIAKPDKIAIMGGSYGGYATLAGMTFSPDVFACGVDICGISNLTSHIMSVPPYWLPEIEKEFRRVGDYRTEEGRQFLKERSPLTYANRIEKPLLIAQGANDPRVKKEESEQIVSAMLENDIPVVYVLYKDEGHGFVRPENRLSFYAIAESFLAEVLGGRAEPIKDAFEGANLTIPVGVELVPGLAEAMASGS
jgi:dipeptidyl aminopeptidase/acylaminoacyl peptidase